MAALKQIEQELAALDNTTREVAEELDGLYRQYLAALGQATRQQLILASYYLCTQAYPDRFLTLSVGQRQALQKELRQVGDQAESQINLQRKLARVLVAQMDLIGLASQLADHEADPQTHQTGESTDSSDVDLAESGSDAVAADSPTADGAELSSATPGADSAESQDSEEAAEAAQDEGRDQSEEDDDDDDGERPRIITLSAADLDLVDQPLTPMVLAKRHVMLEQGLREVLQSTSKAANYLLQQAEILPKLPEALLAAAVEEEPRADSPLGQPNLINLLVETVEGQFRDPTTPEAEADSDSDSGSEADSESESETADDRPSPLDPRQFGRDRTSADSSDGLEDDYDDMDSDADSDDDGYTYMTFEADDDSSEFESESEADDRRRSAGRGSRSHRRTANVTHLVALQLRLTEIEFTDSTTSAWRSKLRAKLMKLKKLAQLYKRKQRQRAIAEAEAAWRACWFDQ